VLGDLDLPTPYTCVRACIWHRVFISVTYCSCMPTMRLWYVWSTITYVRAAFETDSSNSLIFMHILHTTSGIYLQPLYIYITIHIYCCQIILSTPQTFIELQHVHDHVYRQLIMKHVCMAGHQVLDNNNCIFTGDHYFIMFICSICVYLLDSSLQ